MNKNLAIIASLALAAVAFAGPVTGPVYSVQYMDGQYGQGGAFRFQTKAATGGATGNWATVGFANNQNIYTYCLETTVSGFGNFATIDDKVYYDGSLGPIDLLAPSKINVREVYATYALAGGADAGLGAVFSVAINNGNRDSLNKQLQAYIWKSMGYVTWPGDALLPANETLLNNIVNNQYWRVKALNLWTTSNLALINNPAQSGNPYDRQSQFILVAVPVPAAALLGLIGLGSAAWMKRRGN